LARSYQHEIDRIAGQAVAGNGEARHAFVLKNLEADANDARQDDIRGDSIGEGQGQNRRQPVVGQPEDINDQPDAQDAQPEDEHAAQQAFQQSHGPATLKRSISDVSIA
jgi:hypothetical protein